MAVDAYMVFVSTSGGLFTSESQVDSRTITDPFAFTGAKPGQNNFFEITDWSVSSSQTLNIGSQSTGAGAGKVTFNPFSITRVVDHFSQTLFLAECQGTTFRYVDLLLTKSAGDSAPQVYLGYRFGLVAVKSIDWTSDDESPKEQVGFEYGALQVAYRTQNADGQLNPASIYGWDRVRNIKTP